MFVAYPIAAGLLLSAVAKLVSRDDSLGAVVNLGFSNQHSRRLVWLSAVILEFAVAGLLVAVPVAGLIAASALFTVFAGVLARALARGSSGRPCGCLGSRGTVSVRMLAFDLTVAAVALIAAINELGFISPTVAISIAIAVLGITVAGLAITVVALAREVGVIKLALSSGGALEIAGEGPEVGSRHDIPGSPRAEDLTLAVFTSEGCPMCRNLGPSLEFLARDPRLTVLEFDEVRDLDRWRSLDIPGSPYAVAFSNDGLVLAKGTFNGLNQLESVVATAVRRRKEAMVAA